MNSDEQMNGINAEKHTMYVKYRKEKLHLNWLVFCLYGF